ncbi:Uncharacterized protein MJ1618 [Geodia barretti]|uniref:Uncharacterized protein MJ1618 n=1 Tax=Geodia barretti TaxID=519541 RepID=A0AA35RLS6_GEOBA|nr:Uncharacterized protein MJ1618 [Geodia barretti]
MEAKGVEEEAREHTRRADVEAFVTKDGSVVRELMHPNVHGNSNTSVAECIVAPGQTTLLHKHHKSEEIYHITAGSGLMELGGPDNSWFRLVTLCALTLALSTE